MKKFADMHVSNLIFQFPNFFHPEISRKRVLFPVLKNCQVVRLGLFLIYNLHKFVWQAFKSFELLFGFR